MSATLIPPFVFLLLALTSRLYEIALLNGLFVALGCPLLAVLQGTGSLIRGQSRLRAAFYTVCGVALLVANLVTHFT